MKKLSLTFLLLSAFSLPCALARAASYTCELRGIMSGGSLGFAPDGEYLRGYGTYTCLEVGGGLAPRVIKTPVHLTFAGGLGFDYSLMHSVRIVADEIGDVRSPRDLLGEFSVGTGAGLTLLHPGYNSDSAVLVKQRTNGIGFSLKLIGENAPDLGTRLDGFALRVEPVTP